MSKVIQASIKHKYSTIPGKQGTVPATASPDDGEWLDTDLFDGQILFNKPDKKAYVRLGNEIQSWSTGGAAAGSGILTHRIEIVGQRILLPGASGLTLEEIREYYTAHVGGEEVLTNEQTELENQTNGTVNLGTTVYDGSFAYIKQYVTT